jgi:hypothetical protein
MGKNFPYRKNFYDRWGGMKADLSIDFHSVAVHQDALEVDGID